MDGLVFDEAQNINLPGRDPEKTSLILAMGFD
jgi:hypothetical protein